MLFVRLFGLCLFGIAGFLFLLGSGRGVGGGRRLRFVIVALPGLFSYFFFLTWMGMFLVEHPKVFIYRN